MKHIGELLNLISEVEEKAELCEREYSYQNEHILDVHKSDVSAVMYPVKKGREPVDVKVSPDKVHNGLLLHITISASDLKKYADDVYEKGLDVTLRIHKPEVKYSAVEVLDALLTEFNFKPRVRGCFDDLKLRTVRDILRHSETTLLRSPGFGRKGLGEIKEFLKDYGLTLDRW